MPIFITSTSFSNCTFIVNNRNTRPRCRISRKIKLTLLHLNRYDIMYYYNVYIEQINHYQDIFTPLQTSFCPQLNIYFYDMQINTWLHGSSWSTRIVIFMGQCNVLYSCEGKKIGILFQQKLI